MGTALIGTVGYSGQPGDLYYTARATAVLSDGTIVAAVFGQNTGYELWWSSDRVTWTRVVVTTAVATGVLSLAVEDSGDHLQILLTNGANLYWSRLVKGAGHTWTAGARETVFLGQGGSACYSADLDVLTGAGACCIVAKIITDPVFAPMTNKENIVVYGRGTNNTYSSPVVIYAASTAGNSTDPCACAADMQGAVSGSQRVFVAGQANQANAPGAQTTWVATCVVNVTTGAVSGLVFNAATYNGLSMAGSNTYGRIQAFRGPSAGTWYFIAATWASSTTATILPDYYAWDGTNLNKTTGTTYTTTTDWLLWCRPGFDMVDVSLTYKKLAVALRRAAGGCYCVTYDYNAQTWVSSFVYATTPTSDNFLGGGSHRDTSSLNTADFVMLDVSNPSGNNGGLYYALTNSTPSVPASIPTPAAGATVNTDTPIFGVNLPTMPVSRKMQIQVANDSAFTTALKTQAEPDSAIDAVTLHTMVLSVGNILTQGTKYLKALTQDVFGKQSAYTASQTFIDSHQAIAINLSPTSGEGRAFGGGGVTTMTWTFTSTSPGDFQTAYQIIILRNVDSAAVFDSGKVVSGVASCNSTIPAAFKDVLLRYTVTLWDKDNVVGPASSAATFVITDAPLAYVAVGPNILPTNQQNPTDATGFTPTNATLAGSGGVLTLTSVAAGVVQAASAANSPVLPNQSYTMMARFKATSGASLRSCTLQITWLTAALATISTSVIAVTDSVDGVVNYLTATSPGTAAFASMQLFYTATAASEAHNVRSMNLSANSVTNPSPPFNWIFQAATGKVQANYRLVIQLSAPPSTVVYDSGVVNGAVLTATPPSAVISTGNTYLCSLYLVDANGISAAVATVTVVCSFTVPTNPAFSLDGTTFDTLGYMGVSWTNAVKDAAWASWKVYRRVSAGIGTSAQLFTLQEQSFDTGVGGTGRFAEWVGTFTLDGTRAHTGGSSMKLTANVGGSIGATAVLGTATVAGLAKRFLWVYPTAAFTTFLVYIGGAEGYTAIPYAEFTLNQWNYVEVSGSYLVGDGFSGHFYANGVTGPIWVDDFSFTVPTLPGAQSGVAGPWVQAYEISSDQANYVFKDSLPGAGVSYDYCVVQKALRFGAFVEGGFV